MAMAMLPEYVVGLGRIVRGLPKIALLGTRTETKSLLTLA